MDKIYLTTDGKYLTDDRLSIGEIKLLKSLAYFNDGANFRTENYHDIIHTTYNGFKRSIEALQEHGYLVIIELNNCKNYLFNN